MEAAGDVSAFAAHVTKKAITLFNLFFLSQSPTTTHIRVWSATKSQLWNYSAG